MATRRLITTLLLTWTLGLGLIKAGVQPAYVMRQDMVPACDTGCEEEQNPATENCLAVCMVWCATTGFSAVSETEQCAIHPGSAGRVPGWEHFQGLTRSARPLLPPPKG